MMTIAVPSEPENSPRSSTNRGKLQLRGLILGLFVSLWLSVGALQAQSEKAPLQPSLRTRNVILITVDGLRWQEVFGGADVTLMDKDAGGVKDLPALTKRFQRETARESREALMPFFWSTVAQQGIVFGDPNTSQRQLSRTGGIFRTLATVRSCAVLQIRSLIPMPKKIM